MITSTKTKIANIVLWAAYLLALAASMGHIAWSFGTLEFPGAEWAGWLAALAVDAGLAALAYGVQQRKRARRRVVYLWIGVITFAAISAFANLLHALTAVTGSTVTLATFGAIDALGLAKAVILSASLPLLVVYLGEVVSSDDVQAAEQARKLTSLSDFDGMDIRKGTPEWAVLRRLIWERDDKTCANCGGDVSDGRYECHHIMPESLGGKGEARNLITLCPSCHNRKHANRRDNPDSTQNIRQAQRKALAEQAVSNLLAFYGANPGATQAQAAQEVARSRQWVSATLTQLEQAGRIRRNGDGVEVADSP